MGPSPKSGRYGAETWYEMPGARQYQNQGYHICLSNISSGLCQPFLANLGIVSMLSKWPSCLHPKTGKKITMVRSFWGRWVVQPGLANRNNHATRDAARCRWKCWFSKIVPLSKTVDGKTTMGPSPITTSILHFVHLESKWVLHNQPIIFLVKTFGFWAWPHLVFEWTSLSPEAIGLMCWIWLQDVMLGMRFQAPSQETCRQLGNAELALLVDFLASDSTGYFAGDVL